MPRQINIRPVLNGFVVDVGCQQVVVKSIDELCNSLREYLLNPEATEQRFLKEAVNKVGGGSQGDTACQVAATPYPTENAPTLGRGVIVRNP